MALSRDASGSAQAIQQLGKLQLPARGQLEGLSTTSLLPVIDRSVLHHSIKIEIEEEVR